MVSTFRELRGTEAAIEETAELSADPEMAELAAEEMKSLQDRREILLDRVRTLLIPSDPERR